MFYFVSASLVISSILIAVLGNESRKGLKRNWWAGLRTSVTLSSDEAFRLANQKVWKLYIVIALILFIEGAGVAILPYSDATDEVIAIFILTSSFIVLTLAGIQYIVGSRAAKSVSDT